MPSVAEFIQCDARNYTRGRQGNAVRKVVVHYTATGASAHDNLLYFSRSKADASAHYFIDKDGALRQNVREADTAWHAGNWPMNLMSVGIEVVSAGEDFTETQITALAALVGALPALGPRRNPPLRRDAQALPGPVRGRRQVGGAHRRITGGGAAAGDGPGDAGPAGSVGELARRVIAGEFGNGDARRSALGARYAEVQAEVNRMLGGGESGGGTAAGVDDLARRVIEGEFGNGEARKALLGSRYAEVQQRENEILGAGAAAGGESLDVDALARAVIRGDYGNGEERRRHLGARYDAVQRRVNELLR